MKQTTDSPIPLDGYRRAETRWLAQHWDWLCESCAGEWIALQDYALIAHGKDLSKVVAESKDKGSADPLLTSVPRREFQGAIRKRSPRIER